MEAVNRFALKEWASVCGALAAGRQIILLRTGGIDEGPEGFRPQHSEFWLYPTRFHQAPDEISPAAQSFLAESIGNQPPDGRINISLYAVVEAVHLATDFAVIERLANDHILSAATVRDRFHYREPRLFVMAVRVYRRADPFELTVAPHFEGCRSWVDLRNKLPTSGLTPVLDDGEFAKRLDGITNLIGE